MDEGILDYSGYPIAQLYLALRAEAKARKINVFGSEFQNNRLLFLDLGIPPERIMTAVPQLICTRFTVERQGIPTDYDKDVNLPSILK